MSARPIADTLRHLQGGAFMDQASEKLAELVSAVDSTGKGGKLTLTISIKKANRSAMAVLSEIKLSKPQEAPDSTLMFPTPEGNLLTHDPRQQDLPLRKVEVAAPAELKKAVS